MKHLKKRLAIFLAGLLYISILYNPYVVKVSSYSYLKNIQKQWILFQTRDYDELQTKHFVIRHDVIDKDIVSLVAEAAEEKYSAVCEMFGYYPAHKTTIIIYDDEKQLMKNTNLKIGKPPMGVYLASTIQILSPRFWIANDEDMRALFLNEGPVVHEFAHLLVDNLANSNYPLWLTEGIALYQEYIHTGYEWGKDLDYPAEPYTIEQLTKEFNSLDEMLAYKRSFEIVKGIAEKKGFESLNQLIRALGKGKSLRQASIQTLGAPIDEIYK